MFKAPVTPEQTGSQEVIDFNAYRSFCDQTNPGTRKNGLLNEDLLHAAMTDVRTVAVDQDELGSVPVMVPIEYVEGYDRERSEKLARDTLDGDDKEVFYWSYPATPLSDEQVAAIAETITAKTSPFAFYFEYSDHETDATRSNIQRLEAAVGKPLSFGEIREPNAAEGLQEPELIMHSYEIVPTSVYDGPAFERPVEYFDYEVEQGMAEKWPENGLTVCSGTQLTEDLKQQIWELYKDRFQWLGANHPVSMEDTEAEFNDVLCSPQTTMSLAFKDGKVACMTYATENIAACYWLNADEVAATSQPDTRDIYFIGIVSDINNGISYGVDTSVMLGSQLHKTGQKYRILFETTNLSEAYIPKITHRTITGSGFTIDRETVLDHTAYQVASFES